MTEHLSDQESKLLKAVADTLGNMAFLEVLPHTDEESQPLIGDIEEPIWCAIHSKSPFTISLFMVMPKDLCREVINIIFGGAPGGEPAPGMVGDTMGELINTIAGRLMTELIPSDRSFELGLPEVGEGLPKFPADSCEQWFVMGQSLFMVRSAGLIQS